MTRWMATKAAKAATATKALMVPVVAAAALVAASTATASAIESAIPMTSTFRACDFTKLDTVVARGDGRAVAHVGTTTGNVSARVDMVTAEPNTVYVVRVIQVPRPSIGCGPGAPGVALGSLITDGAGAGSTTVQGPIAAGKNGAWVIVERDGENTQIPAEFYTSEYVAKF